MKKILLALFLVLPLVSWAEKEDDNPKHDPKYMRGAVPEVNGVVVFSDTLDLTGKARIDIYQSATAYVQELVDNGAKMMAERIQYDDHRNRVITDNDLENFTVIAKVEEVLTFAKKPLYWDHTYFRYLIAVEVPEDGKAIVKITQISYYYRMDNDGQNGEIYKAEEWINDKNAVKKNNKSLQPVSGKFRRHTIDRVEEIFKGLDEKVRG